jgi:hypothetical protein
MPAIHCSSRWRSMVRACLIEYTAEMNELESYLSSTVAMAVWRCSGQYNMVEVSLRAQAALVARRDVDALLG